MTYKAIVKELIRNDAKAWVEKLLNENGIAFRYTLSETSELKHDKESNTILWTAKIEIKMEGQRDLLTVYAGGTADDFLGICHSVLWNKDMKKILWMANYDTRKSLGIKTFQIA